VTVDTEPTYVLLSRPTGNLLGEFPTRAEAEAAREQYVALDARNADVLEIVFDDGRGDEPVDDELPRAS
jgi:hypothetical protein